uniref:Uncharacterized protein n=1 Tax=Zea mays TaxID=4577 RepID=C4J7I6_MAIZE|nr:unknown [Zea mays]
MKHDLKHLVIDTYKNALLNYRLIIIGITKGTATMKLPLPIQRHFLQQVVPCAGRWSQD